MNSFYRRLCFLSVLLLMVCGVGAQTLSLEDCRKLALQNNKQLSVARLKQEVAKDAKGVAKAQYLPKVDVLGSYVHTTKEISLLNDKQKATFNSLGTTTYNSLATNLPSIAAELIGSGLITPEQAVALGDLFNKYGEGLKNGLDGLGQKVTDAFRTDTRNIWVGSIVVAQPIYMGGKLTAMNKIADISQDLAANETASREQTVLINTDKAYWLVVSLRHKKALAQQYYDLVKTLEDDVDKMVKSGVATKANKLSVSVKVNEADMTLTQVDNGLALSKMALCQICGLPIDSKIVLKDEEVSSFDVAPAVPTYPEDMAINNRPEIKMLENANDIAEQGVKLARSGYLPTVAMTAGWTISNPNVFNGYQKKFGDVFDIGVVFRMPLWNWGETKYKIRSAKATKSISALELADAKDLVRLQVNQNEFKLNEANKKLIMTKKNIKSAEENLRAATLGFKEGVMTSSNVIEAQTAWLVAHTQQIDAAIDVKLAQTELKKTLGILHFR